MNMNSWKKEFENKNILIWGYGMEGRSTYRFIRSLFPDMPVTIADGGKGLARAEEETIHSVCLSDKAVDLSQFDLIMKAPGIVCPENWKELPITNEAQLFLKHYGDRTIGITGTKGKSTTTSLVYHLLSQKYETVLVGNIGKACFDEIEKMENGALAAFEISCHQLEHSPYSPHVGVYLNLYEEHLDHYGSFQAYGDAKFNVVKNQKAGDVAIMWEHLDQYLNKTVNKPVLIGKDIYAEGRTLHIPGKVLKVEDCKLIGAHNYQNLAVAWYVADLYGLSEEEVLKACASFQPLHHRLENLGNIDGITYVNDSISTIGQACILALKSIDHVDTVLVGGMDRGISYTELEDYLAKSSVQVIFMYATGHRILEEMKQRGLLREGLYEVEDLKEAVVLAKKLTAPGHTCLLSPAASSYDHFKNFEERGTIFEQLAREKA